MICSVAKSGAGGSQKMNFPGNLFPQAANEKEVQESTKEWPIQAQRRFNSRKAPQERQEKGSRTSTPFVAAGAVSCRLIRKF
jgi:hypothetical protein